MLCPVIDPEKIAELLKCAEGCRDAGADALKISDFWPLVEAARAHLATLPHFKEVEVWRVEWAHPGNRVWKPYAAHYLTELEAMSKADSCRNRPQDHACVRVTGPHKQRVPA